MYLLWHSTARARNQSAGMPAADKNVEREVALAAVVRDGLALQRASAELRADREVRPQSGHACITVPSVAVGETVI